MLIMFDTSSADYQQQHLMLLQHVQMSNDPFLKTIFSQPKSNKTQQEENCVRRLGGKVHQSIFESLLKTENKEHQVKQNGILPKLSQVLVDQQKQIQKCKFETKLQSMINKTVSQENENSYSSQNYERDTLNLQMEFGQLREMQKLLNEMKMAKIEKHRKNKNRLLKRNQRQVQKQQLMSNQTFLNQLFDDLFSDKREPIYQYPQEYH